MPKDFVLFLGLKEVSFAESIKERLSASFTISVSTAPDSIINTMLEVQPDLAILDYSIPEIDIIELCEKFRDDQPHINTVIYVMLDSLAVAKRKWKQRALDYIVGPAEVEEFCEDINKVVRYILLDRERESFIRHKIETHYLINKKLGTLKELCAEALKSKNVKQIEVICKEMHSLEESLKDIEKFNI